MFVDGLILVFKNGVFGVEDLIDVVLLVVSFVSNGWFVNIVCGVLIMFEFSMVWCKASSVGESEGVSGWIIDVGGRDSLILIEIFDVDLDVVSIEE